MTNPRSSRSSNTRWGGRSNCRWKRCMASINTTWSSRDALRRTALVAFCLLLLGTIVLVFTRVVAARVPEQRATLEKLITDRTGLAVRFENVHFAWGLDGTSAVFTRVELTDPTA